jgi:hypothetical protein
MIPVIIATVICTCGVLSLFYSFYLCGEAEGYAKGCEDTRQRLKR